ncbi:MAG: Bug family tripartite tricarboxylate transporter substrate binding protein [Limnohabitans sp.]|jgi:tripartite-type tricarboxylate transporter receptor subunit TctC
MSKFQFFRRGLWGAALLLSCFAVQAQSYPSQPIKLMVPWPPGGGVDTTARMIAEPLGRKLGQSVVIDNRAGAGGNIGTELAARAKPDGYNLLMGSITPNAINVHLYPKLPFDLIKDFTPIAFVSSLPIFLVVPPNSPFKTVADLVAYAQSNPNKLSYGSAGVGSSQHLAAVQFMSRTKLEMLHVPYKGTSPAETDLMAGHLSLMLDTATCIPFVRSGKLRALAVASKNRNPALPNVPTFDEAGVSNLYASSWYGLMGPAGLPQALVSQLNSATNEVLRSPEVLRRMQDLGAEIGGGSPEEFAQFIQSEIQRYADIVKKSGARAE